MEDPQQHPTIRLLPLPEKPDEATATILVSESVQSTVVIDGLTVQRPAGETTFECGHCAAALAVHMKPPYLSNLALGCNRCGRYSAVTDKLGGAPPA
jgi:hypothetical protein